jgi:hypothetical protein
MNSFELALVGSDETFPPGLTVTVEFEPSTMKTSGGTDIESPASGTVNVVTVELSNVMVTGSDWFGAELIGGSGTGGTGGATSCSPEGEVTTGGGSAGGVVGLVGVLGLLDVGISSPPPPSPVAATALDHDPGARVAASSATEMPAAISRARE